MVRFRPSRRLTRAVPTLLVAATLFTLGAHVSRVAKPVTPARVPDGMEMSDEAMKQWLADWYAKHPAHGARIADGPAADTFRVVSFRFDTDGKSATQIDTARIVAGQSVLWQWVDGFHTATSGAPTDPVPGELFDFPMDPGNTLATFQFDTPGTYPFFCAPHGTFFNMKGVVVVAPNPLAVPPAATDAGVGFVAAPWPNPTRDGASFRFAVPQDGAASLRVFDASGRLVARVLDEDLRAGTFVAAWSGRTADGRPAAPGAYFARLVAPGVNARARIVVTR